MIRREPKALTGVRPTGELTIGNYLGAIQPVVNMQEEFDGPIGVFVADIHGLTGAKDSFRHSTSSCSCPSCCRC